MFRLEIKASRRGPGASEAMAKYVHNQYVQLWKKCVRSFVMTAVRYVHIDTGMSRGSLIPVAREVKSETYILAALAGRNEPKKGAYRPLGNRNESFKYDPSAIKRPELGRALGSKAYKIDFGSPKTPQFRFQFDIRIFQWHLHENGLGSSGDWGAIEAGKQAFLACWELNANKVISKKALRKFFVTDKQK